MIEDRFQSNKQVSGKVVPQHPQISMKNASNGQKYKLTWLIFNRILDIPAVFGLCIKLLSVFRLHKAEVNTKVDLTIFFLPGLFSIKFWIKGR